MGNLSCSLIFYDVLSVKKHTANILQLLSAICLKTQDLFLTNTVRSNF